MDSISRHEQLLRVFHLIDILFGARQPLATSEIKHELQRRGVIDDMSDRNIRRDLDFLGKFGYAVKKTKKTTARGTAAQAWAIQPGKGAEELRGPAISLPELLSLAVARDFLAPLAGTFYWRGISQLLAKVEKVATPELLAYVEAHKDGLVIHPKPTSSKYGARMLNAIHRAIRNSLELSIRYTSLAGEKPRRYVLRPEAVVLYDGSLYVAARRADADDVRFFKIDRIVEAKPTSKKFSRGSQSVESLLADSITIFRSSDPPRRYRLRIAADRAKWAREKPFHPRQQVREQADGSLVLEIARAWDDEMIPQLLGLGEHVEVLEPVDVRDRVLETAQRIAALYMCRHLREFDEIVAAAGG